MGRKTSRRTFLKSLAAAGCGAAVLPWSSISCSSRRFDLIIRGGGIIDGTGIAAFAGDVGVLDGKIGAVGNLADASAAGVIDARGLVVCPGFIDIHSHTDDAVLKDPRAESKIRQGVTLDVGGNCGDSPFPARKAGIENVGSAADCTSFREYAARATGGFALNEALLVGQGTIRSLVLGEEARQPDARELALMKDLVRQAMEQGAVGLSTGLEYTPSGYADTKEVIELCKVVAEFGGIYATHMRSEDERLVEAVTEAIEICRASGAGLQISHLKAAGRPNWQKVDEVIDLIEKARAEGLDVTCDRYPYLAYSTSLGFFLPGWAREGGRRAMTARLKDRAARRKMKSETMAKVEANGGWETVMIADVRLDDDRPHLGRRISEIASDAGRDPYELFCDLLAKEEGRVSIVGFAMSEENTDRIISLPYVMIASDGNAQSVEAVRGRGKPHPRSFGTFPRAIREYALDKKVLTLPEVIRKMTSLPADKLGFRDCGRIREGARADLVLFDPEKIRDKATYLEPWQYPEGIPHVLVHGTPVISGGVQQNALPGTLLGRARRQHE